MSGTFTAYDDKSPDFPPLTCPDINHVIDVIDEAAKAIRDHADKLEDLTSLKGEIEKLRTQNEELRESGIYWRDAAKELAVRVDELVHELKEVKDALEERELMAERIPNDG